MEMRIIYPGKMDTLIGWVGNKKKGATHLVTPMRTITCSTYYLHSFNQLSAKGRFHQQPDADDQGDDD